MNSDAAARINRIRNSSLTSAVVLLAQLSDHELFDAILCLGLGEPFPPVRPFPMPLELEILIAPTLHAELQRRFEVAALETET